MRTFVLCCCAFALVLSACQKSSPESQSSERRQWLLEKLGKSDFAIARTYLDGFETLTPSERILLYYLTRAAIAGRDIYYDQRHRDALKIRNFFESLLDNKNLPPELRDRVLNYTKKIWANNGQYHARTGLKLPVPFTYDELAQALQGQDIAWLKTAIFDMNVEPVLTNLTPQKSEGDIIQASATNIFGRGITLAEVEALNEFWKTKLNVRFEKIDGKVVGQVYKVGGVYGKELANVVHFLKLAAGLAQGLQKSAIEKLIAYYESGDEEIFKQASIDWLKSQPRVDTINGFIESYMDPRQVVGSWEGISYFTAVDPILSGFSNNVQYFEDRMPWSEIYKRKNITSKPVATMINVAAAIGEGGPITWSGINLPNYQDIRSQHGSKNVILVNMIEARAQVTQDQLITEFYMPEYRDLMKKYYGTARRMMLFMHEVLGHGSGMADPKLTGDPRDYIGRNYGAWEEARASLVAWHHIADPKLIEFGAFKKEEQADVIKALALLELQGQMVQLKNARHEDVLREAHDRADQLIFEYLRRNTAGFEVVEQGGKYFVKIKDIRALLEGASRLLKIVHEAKSTGDRATVDRMLNEYGNRFNTAWRDNIVKRVEEIGYPDLVAMVFPKLVPVFENGKIVDVKVDYTESFEAQQRRFGRISATTEISDRIY